MTKFGRLNVVYLLFCAYGLFVRPRLLRWGATDRELRDTYPGRRIVREGRRTATMAVTIDASPRRVWPWLVQMGCNRAGWYSWDHLDNHGTPSAEKIRPEWQQIAVGDHLDATPGGEAWFEVAALEPERFLALRAPVQLPRGRPFDSAGDRPRFFSDSVWCFQLKELADHRTRLVVSGYASTKPRAITAILDAAFWEPAHWIMQMRQFSNLKRHAERNLECVPVDMTTLPVQRVPVTQAMADSLSRTGTS